MHVSGGGLDVFVDVGGPFGSREQLFDSRSFDPISMTTIGGSSVAFPFGGIGSVAFDVVTPEPATLLFWATSAAGLGLVRWRRHRTHG
jgi:hypothetical protein